MKKILSSLPIIALAGLAFFTGCKKADDVTPTGGKPTATVTFDKSTYGTESDFIVNATVSTTGDTAFITIIADGTQPMGAIYMQYQKDNSQAVNFTQQPNGQVIAAAGYLGSKPDGTGLTAFNYENTGGYTFNIPNSLNKSFKLTIPIKLRSASDNPISDVFTIWITKNGVNGKFKNPAYGLAYGVATVSLKYTTDELISNYATVLGNSADANDGSLFATSTGSNYTRISADSSLARGSKVDFVYTTKSADSLVFGSFYNSTGGVDPIIKFGPNHGTGGFGDVANITNYTKLSIVSDPTVYDNANGSVAVINAVDNAFTAKAPSNKVVFIGAGNADGKVFAFQTAAGKKGLVKITTATGDGTTSGQATISVKVQR